MDFTIRRATVADAATVAQIAARTFHDTFAAQNTAEDMEAHLAREYGEAQQRREIEDSNGITLIAEYEGGAIAYAQIRRGPAVKCISGPSPVEIARFYVVQGWHGRGVAQALMNATKSAAAALGGATLWLGVWERNHRAIAFYEKCGFRDCGSKPFLVGGDLQTDRVMVCDA